eukprot:9586324-Lingulodinium_polyedra.AAC.1
MGSGTQSCSRLRRSGVHVPSRQYFTDGRRRHHYKPQLRSAGHMITIAARKVASSEHVASTRMGKVPSKIKVEKEKDQEKQGFKGKRKQGKSRPHFNDISEGGAENDRGRQDWSSQYQGYDE